MSKKIKLTREEAEQKILDKEYEDVKESAKFGDFSYINDILSCGFKGYYNFTDKQLVKEMNERFNTHLVGSETIKFKIIKEKKKKKK